MPVPAGVDVSEPCSAQAPITVQVEGAAKGTEGGGRFVESIEPQAASL